MGRASSFLVLFTLAFELADDRPKLLLEPRLNSYLPMSNPTTL